MSGLGFRVPGLGLGFGVWGGGRHHRPGPRCRPTACTTSPLSHTLSLSLAPSPLSLCLPLSRSLSSLSHTHSLSLQVRNGDAVPVEIGGLGGGGHHRPGLRCRPTACTTCRNQPSLEIKFSVVNTTKINEFRANTGKSNKFRV